MVNELERWDSNGRRINNDIRFRFQNRRTKWKKSDHEQKGQPIPASNGDRSSCDVFSGRASVSGDDSPNNSDDVDVQANVSAVH